MTKELYHKKLIEHYHHSPYRGLMEHPDFSSQTRHPSCGDKISIAGTVEHGKITALRFEGQGCILSQAAASLLCEYAQGMSATEAQKITNEDMKKLIGVPVGPVRFACVDLSLHALFEGIKSMGALC